MDKIGAIFDLYARITVTAYADASLKDVLMMCDDFNAIAQAEGIDLHIDTNKIKNDITYMAYREE